MPEQPEVSIIIPVYNAATTLKRCLQSVVSSHLTGLEIICINDGSTDNSGKLLADWAQQDPRIKVLAQDNAGVSTARNLGLRQASGQYIVFVDADDEITPTYLSNLLQAARQYDADVVVCGQQQHNARGQYSAITRPFRDIPGLTPEELAKLPPSVCSHMYASRALQTLNGIAQFPLGIRYGEDTAFHYSLYPRCRHAVQIEENGYIIYYTEGSSTSKAATIVFDMLKAVSWLAERYQQYGMTADCRECLVHYAAHTIRRIHSLGLHSMQADAARTMRQILQDAGVSDKHLCHLNKRSASILLDILRGGNGLNLSYYIKRLKKHFHSWHHSCSTAHT